MTIRELSDYLLELLSDNENIDDCEVMIYSANNTGRVIHHLEMGFENETDLIPECAISNYENDESEINQCLILFDSPLEFEEEKSLTSILGFKSK